MEFDEYGGGDDWEWRAGDGRGNGQHDDFSGIRLDQWIDEPDGDSAGTGLDCRDASESLDCEGCDAAVHGHGNL
jgi:hypothetical protein